MPAIVRPYTVDIDSDGTRAQVPAGRTQFGRYHLLRELGRGAMGSVHLAYDPQLARKVALKIVRPDDPSLGPSDPTVQQLLSGQLVIEAKALAKLTHTNVLAVFDVGVEGDEVFMATEFVEGQSLDRWFESAEHPWMRIIEVSCAAGRGLAAAHAAGLIHRDFKPANVMIDGEGQPKVLDFGLAGSSTSNTSIEATDASPAAITGTPAYMAPEQILGQSTDARCDQFAFCVTVWQGLTGSRPFAADDLAGRLHNMRNSSLGQGRRHIPRVPYRLEKALTRGLAFAAEDRHPSMHALLVELERSTTAHRQRWRRGAMTFGLCATAWLAATTWPHHASTAQPCEDPQQHWAGIWDSDSKRSMAATFSRADPDSGPAQFERVADTLAARIEQWGEVFETQCTGLAGSDLDLAMRCLNAQLDEYGSLLAEFQSADAGLVRSAVRAAHSLPTAQACLELDALRSAIPEPADPESRARVRKIDLGRADQAEIRYLRLRSELVAATGPQSRILLDLRALESRLGLSPGLDP